MENTEKLIGKYVKVTYADGEVDYGKLVAQDDGQYCIAFEGCREGSFVYFTKSSIKKLEPLWPRDVPKLSR